MFSINLVFCILAFEYFGELSPVAQSFEKMVRAIRASQTGAMASIDSKVGTKSFVGNNYSNSTHHNTKIVTKSSTEVLSTAKTTNMDDRAVARTHNPANSNRVLNVTPLEPKGFILPYKIIEQQTGAARNLLYLQLWAKSVGMKVVEPFINEHKMSFEALVNGTEHPLKFGEIYDRDFWNLHTTLKGCAPLVDWEELLHSASRKVILVLPWGGYQGLENYTVVDSIDDPSKIVGLRKCGPTYFSELAMKYFSNLNFHYIREVCIKFKARNPLTMEQFSQHILGPHQPSDVTVIFARWLGIAHSRVNLFGFNFKTASTLKKGLMPSKIIIKESDKYVQHFNPNGGKYFGVMIRVERTMRVLTESQGFDKVMKYMTQCANELAGLKEFKTHHEWRRTLAIDMGRMGSKGLLNGCVMGNRYCGIDKLFGLFLTSVFGKDGFSVEEYEDSFKKYISMNNPLYVAQIQRTIAARSDCMVVVGGRSNFQAVAISFYKNFHPNVTEQCVIYHCYGEKI